MIGSNWNALSFLINIILIKTALWSQSMGYTYTYRSGHSPYQTDTSTQLVCQQLLSTAAVRRLQGGWRPVPPIKQYLILLCVVSSISSNFVYLGPAINYRSNVNYDLSQYCEAAGTIIISTKIGYKQNTRFLY